MTEPLDSGTQYVDMDEESEALGAANDIAGEGWNAGDDASSSAGDVQPEATPAALPQSPAQQPVLTGEQHRQLWQQTTATRAQLREAAQRNWEERQRYEGMLNAFLTAQREQQMAAQQPQQPQLDPNIDPDLQRYFDSQNQALLARMQEMLQPTLAFQQQQQQQQEVQQQLNAEQQQWKEYQDLITQDEQLYLQTPEGQGYNDRLNGLRDTMSGFLGALPNVHPQVATKLVHEEFKGLTYIAQALGQSPAAFVDGYARALIQWAQGHVSGNGHQQARPVQQAVQMRQPQARVSPQIQMARQATMQGAVGAPPSGGGGRVASGNGVSAADLLDRNLTDKDISAGIKQYGSLDKFIRAMENVAVELDQITG